MKPPSKRVAFFVLIKPVYHRASCALLGARYSIGGLFVLGATRVAKIAVICEQCGKSFGRIPSVAARSKHHFCSKKCSGAWHTKRVACRCAYCGKPLVRYRWEQEALAECRLVVTTSETEPL